MNKRYFGRLVRAKIRIGAPITGEDLLTGIFQRLSFSELENFGKTQKSSRMDFQQLRAYRDWSAENLDGRAESAGSKQLRELSEKWANDGAEMTESTDDVPYAEIGDPRDWKPWTSVIYECHKWLSAKWEKGIGKSRWKREKECFDLVKRVFKGHKVLYQASPLWLSPQVFDIFVPGIDLALEYMGKQHYEAVDFFGGKEGLARTVERDEAKRSKCQQVGVALEEIRYDEDMRARVKEIWKRYDD